MPITGETLLAMAIAVGLYFGGYETVRGVKALIHKTAHALHHQKTPAKKSAN